MGLLRSLAMLLFLLWFLCSRQARAQSLTGSAVNRARALDTLLQDYAFRAFVRPRTGVPFNGSVPSNLTGIQISAIRLRSGSLRRKGVEMYKEFEIPVGVLVQPYVERLVLVYQNLGNWSTMYYPLPGHMYLAPVLGLLAYDASNLLAKNLPLLNMNASLQNILIKFPNVRSMPNGPVTKCVWFDSNGVANFSNLLSGNICPTFRHGHFSVVMESVAPSPAPVSPAPPEEGPSPGTAPSAGKKKSNSKVGIIVGSVLGGLALLVLLGLLVVWVRKYKHRKKMNQMERTAEVGEALHVKTVGSTKAPTAIVTRTQPTLETEYVP